jgi:hypothetical protein
MWPVGLEENSKVMKYDWRASKKILEQSIKV